MMRDDDSDDLVVRAVTGELSEADRERLRARVEADPRLRAELSAAERTAALLRASRVDAFPPGFASRVARRVAAEGSRGPFSASLLQRQFLRLLAPTLAAVLVLAGYALAGPHRFQQTPVESLLGLTPLTGESWIMTEPPPPPRPRGGRP